MTVMMWICLYAIFSLAAKWIISWGGAAYIQGWKSIFFFGVSGSEEWSKEQVIMMAWFFWIAFTAWFLIGLFNPELKFYKLKHSL